MASCYRHIFMKAHSSQNRKLLFFRLQTDIVSVAGSTVPWYFLAQLIQLIGAPQGTPCISHSVLTDAHPAGDPGGHISHRIKRESATERQHPLLLGIIDYLFLGQLGHNKGHRCLFTQVLCHHKNFYGRTRAMSVCSLKEHYIKNLHFCLHEMFK